MIALAFYLGGIVGLLPVAIGVSKRGDVSAIVALLMLSIGWPLAILLILTGVVRVNGGVEPVENRTE